MHKFYFDSISKTKSGIVAAFCRAMFLVLSGFYASGVYLRGFFYKKPYRPNAFTISIGNIVAGGTGKTPFVIFLARQLKSVAILLRGYKAEVEDAKIPFMFQKEAPVALVGDEAALIAKNVPEAKIFCSKKKAASALMADGYGLRYLVIDDGMQHKALARDLDIVMLDSENPFGYGYLLPRGLLREPLSALSRADLIVITCRNGHDIRAEDEALLRQYTKASVCKVRFRPEGIFDLQGTSHHLPVGTKVGLFCAIAKPEQFVESVRLLGLDVVYTKFFTDHATVTEIELQKMVEEAKRLGADRLITTEKDMVKLATSLPILYLKVGIEMMTPSIWDEFYNKISSQSQF